MVTLLNLFIVQKYNFPLNLLIELLALFKHEHKHMDQHAILWNRCCRKVQSNLLL